MRFPSFLAAAASLAALPWLVRCGGSPPAPSLVLNDVVFGSDGFIAVGSKEDQLNPSGPVFDEGVILTSTDGTAWKQVQIDVNLPLLSVARGNGRFVAVGGADFAEDSGRSGVVLVSGDGHAWERVDPDPDVGLSGVVYGQGRFVVTTFDQRVLTSIDGHDWTFADATVKIEPQIPHITFGNGVFVTYSGTFIGDPEIAVSPDAVAWSPLEITNAPELPVQSVSFAGNAFFAGLQAPCGEVCSGPFPVARSTDGKTWSEVTQDLGGGGLADVAFQNGVFVGAAHTGLARSTDGKTWSMASDVENRAWAAVAAGPPGFVAVGSGFVAHSADGAAWAEIPVDVP